MCLFFIKKEPNAGALAKFLPSSFLRQLETVKVRRGARGSGGKSFAECPVLLRSGFALTGLWTWGSGLQAMGHELWDRGL